MSLNDSAYRGWCEGQGLSYGQEKAATGRRVAALRRRLSHLTTPPPYKCASERDAWALGYDQALRDIAARPDVREELR